MVRIPLSDQKRAASFCQRSANWQKALLGVNSPLIYPVLDDQLS
jgi:hypothetical protein